MNSTLDLQAKILRAHGEVERGVSGARERLRELQRKYRTGRHIVERHGGTCQLVEVGAGPATVSRPKTAGQRSPERPSWHLGSKEPLSYRDVELREHFVAYSVSLTPRVKEDILTEIKRAHRDAGEQIEAAGWLFAHYLPRAESDSIEVTHVTRSGSRPGTQTSVTLSDPIDAMAAVRAVGLGHLKLVGDWHSHCRGGSLLPSDADARAWAGTMDGLGREAYVSVIVSPSESTGWTIPRFTAWVAGRHGSPSRPIVGRARVE